MAFSKGDIAAPFIQVKEDENGVLQDIKFVNDDNFNFAYDVVDKMAKKDPDKVAMLHISKDGKERSFTFYDMARYSSKVANYLQFLGIKKGDRVMLVLKRHYQFWFAILALHKIGAVAIPATNLLLKSDFEYRFKAGNVDAILCTADGPVSREVDKACRSYKNLKVKKAVVGFVAGNAVPFGHKMGYAGDVITKGHVTAQDKQDAMSDAGIIVVNKINNIHVELMKLFPAHD